MFSLFHAAKLTKLAQCFRAAAYTSIFAVALTDCGGGSGSTSPSPLPSTGPQTGQLHRPCDLYASTTPCAAAYSTTRSLYGAYTGALYQVLRQSDNTTADIGLLSDGYANAVTQDTFCTNTTCVIKTIYDQSANHNNLTVAPPGQQASGAGPNGYDLPAIANALPIMAGGHKVYGINIVPGMGYRNDVTTGVPTGKQPQGVYMVSSPIHINGNCCFDFGNAETTNNDDGAGRMDSINLFCPSTVGPPCQRAALDLENGLFGFLPVTSASNFVTAMGSNDGQQSFSIWQGDSDAGGLTSTGPIALLGKYTPMQEEGAIILGIGGDNSNRGAGYFFEGVMTSGAPTDAMMNTVESNVNGVGYSGLN